MPIEAAFDLPPREALAFFRAKGLRVSFAWQDVWAAEHEAAFTVAKMADVDLLADVKAAVDAAIADGTTLEVFKRELVPKLTKAGWWGVREQEDPVTGKRQLVQLGSTRRMGTIFRTNMLTSYSAGEWAQIEATADSAPFLMYAHNGAENPRPQHVAWDGIVLPWDHPWWDTHRPINGWGCHCSTIQLSARDMRALGKSEPDKAPPIKMREWTNRRTGEVMQVPVGIDAGFDYNPGKGRQAHLQKLLDEKRQAFEGN